MTIKDQFYKKHYDQSNGKKLTKRCYDQCNGKKLEVMGVEINIYPHKIEKKNFFVTIENEIFYNFFFIRFNKYKNKWHFGTFDDENTEFHYPFKDEFRQEVVSKIENYLTNLNN